MQFAIVKGSVVATQKVPHMQGYALKVMQPCNEDRLPLGDLVVALDPIGARTGDLVMWVAKREASLAVPDAQLANMYPIDAAITGIIDDIG